MNNAELQLGTLIGNSLRSHFPNTPLDLFEAYTLTLRDQAAPGIERVKENPIDPRFLKIAVTQWGDIQADTTFSQDPFSNLGFFGITHAKPGKEHCGDIIYSSPKITIVADGVTPLNYPEKDLNQLTEPLDRTGAQACIDAFRLTAEVFEGTAPIEDLLKGAIIKTINIAYDTEATLRFSPRAAFVAALTGGRYPYLIKAGDLHTIIVLKDGSYYQPFPSSSNGISRKCQAVDRIWGALSRLVPDQQLLQLLLEASFQLKVANGIRAGFEDRMRLFTLTRNKDELIQCLSLDDIHLSTCPIPNDTAYILIGSDGIAHEPNLLPFFGFFPLFYNLHPYFINNRYPYIPSDILGQNLSRSVRISRQIYLNQPWTQQRRNGPADDDAALAVLKLTTLEPNEHGPHRAAFAVSQERALKLIEHQTYSPNCNGSNDLDYMALYNLACEVQRKYDKHRRRSEPVTTDPIDACLTLYCWALTTAIINDLPFNEAYRQIIHQVYPRS